MWFTKCVNLGPHEKDRIMRERDTYVFIQNYKVISKYKYMHSFMFDIE